MSNALKCNHRLVDQTTADENTQGGKSAKVHTEEDPFVSNALTCDHRFVNCTFPVDYDAVDGHLRASHHLTHVIEQTQKAILNLLSNANTIQNTILRELML